ncbi:MAG TPA: hypothetical protein VN783_00070 [Thermoanaerobaculia bacterium]|nr:hypothetical protein [Thermoanaerobaculia bacterium]
MRRLLYLWLSLLGAYFLATAALSALAGNPIDRSDAGILCLVAIPVAQAIALGWATRGPRSGRRLALPPGRIGRALLLLAGLDVAVTLLGGLLPEDPWFALNAGGAIPHLFSAAQAAGAAVFAASLAARRPEDRLPLALLAAALAGYALDAGLDVLSLPSRFAAPRSPLLAWLAIHGAAVVLGGALLLHFERRWRNTAPAAARLFEAALGIGLLAALGSLLGLLLPPEVGQPIYALGCLAGFLALTAILAGLASAPGGGEIARAG